MRAPVIAVLTLAVQSAFAQPKPVPRMQAIPMPYDEVSFQRDGVELARAHCSPVLVQRPYVFPIIGPSGRSLTRMGHPGAPFTHSHHNSVWLGIGTLNGVDFWSDRGPGRVVHQRVEMLDDGDERASLVTLNKWVAGAKVFLQERREIQVWLLDGKDWMLVLDSRLEAPGENVVIEKERLGPIGVRTAKSIGVHFGGGTIRNSEGAVGEAAIFRKRARWVDSSGLIANGVTEGLTLMDHPSNPGHPAYFHVRDDGWMGVMLANDQPFTFHARQPVSLRYAVYVHAGAPPPEKIERYWRKFAESPLHLPVGPPRTIEECNHGDSARFNTPRTFKNQAECESYVRSAK